MHARILLARGYLLVAALLAASALNVPTAAAGGDDSKSERAKELAARGFDAYDKEDFAKAISFFEQAQAIAPAPGLLYNIAQSYRLMGDAGCQPALEYYQEYRSAMRAAGEPKREGLRARIVEMQECVDEDEVENDEDEDEDEVSEPGEPDPEPGREAVETSSLAVAPEHSKSSRKTAWIVTSLGASSALISAVTGVLALDRESELSVICESSVCASDFRDRVKTYDRLRYTSYATGAFGLAALATGAWLLLSDSAEETQDSPGHVSTKATPWVGHRSAGVQWQF